MTCHMTNNAFCPVQTKTISLQKVISLSEKLNFSLILPHLAMPQFCKCHRIITTFNLLGIRLFDVSKAYICRLKY